MSLLDPLLFGAVPAGIYHTVLLNDLGRSDAAAAIDSRGWDSVILHGEDIADKATWIAHVAEALGFPAETGRNWDAVEDFIQDMSWSLHDNRVIVWTSPETLQLADAKAHDTAMDILRETVSYWSNKGQHFSVVLSTDQTELTQAFQALN